MKLLNKFKLFKKESFKNRKKRVRKNKKESGKRKLKKCYFVKGVVCICTTSF